MDAARGSRRYTTGYVNSLDILYREQWLASREPTHRVTDHELRAAFAHVLRPDVPDEKFRLALQLFAVMEADR